MICPVTVAMAAPATPSAGKPNSPKIMMGSSTMLMAAPASWLTIVRFVRPVEARIFSFIVCRNRPMPNTDTIHIYWNPSSAMTAEEVCRVKNGREISIPVTANTR